jgi:hypothetical protein
MKLAFNAYDVKPAASEQKDIGIKTRKMKEEVADSKNWAVW